MIRISKLTDYSIVLLTHFASEPDQPVKNARDLAAAARMPVPTVCKLLKALSKGALLVSHRGVKGGYSLARPAGEITVAQIIDAIEGPIAVTECSQATNLCTRERLCPVRPIWQRVNGAVRESLDQLTLLDIAGPPATRQETQEPQDPRSARRPARISSEQTQERKTP